jgi:hypothetical protein
MVIVLLFLILCHESFCKLQGIHQVNLSLAAWGFDENLRLAIMYNQRLGHTRIVEGEGA